MPPLCTAGYGLGTGNFYYFIGAFYLFLINSVFISVSTFLIVRYLKFKPVSFVNEETEKKVRKFIWWIVILTIIPSIFLAYRFVQQEIFKQNAEKFINIEIRANGMFVIDKTINASERKIELFIYGEKLTDSLSQTIVKKKKLYDLENAELSIEQTINTNQRTKELMAARPDISLELKAQLIEKDKMINDLTKRLSNQFQVADSSIYKEFTALYGQPKELIISRTLDFTEQGSDTITLVYYSLINRVKRIDKSQLENWLKERTKSKRLKVVSN